MLKLIFREYDAYKVFQINCMTAMWLDFLTEKVKTRNSASRPGLILGLFPTDMTMILFTG